MAGQVTGLFFATMVDRYASLDKRDFADGHYTDNQNGVIFHPTCFHHVSTDSDPSGLYYVILLYPLYPFISLDIYRDR